MKIICAKVLKIIMKIMCKRIKNYNENYMCKSIKEIYQGHQWGKWFGVITSCDIVTATYLVLFISEMAVWRPLPFIPSGPRWLLSNDSFYSHLLTNIPMLDCLLLQFKLAVFLNRTTHVLCLYSLYCRVQGNSTDYFSVKEREVVTDGDLRSFNSLLSSSFRLYVFAKRNKF